MKVNDMRNKKMKPFSQCLDGDTFLLHSNVYMKTASNAAVNLTEHRHEEFKKPYDFLVECVVCEINIIK